jgi:aminopeptidase
MDSTWTAYARLLLEAGVNLERGQKLMVGAEPVHWPFLAALAEEAYALGAAFVEVDAPHPRVGRARVRNGEASDLTFVPGYQAARFNEMLDGTWARLALVGAEDPELMSDADPQRTATVQKAVRTAARPLMDACSNGTIPWCVAALPTAGWAAKIFGEEPTDALRQRLWEAMIPILRLDRPDPAQAWRDLAAASRRRCGTLDQCAIRRLHFEAEETDLTVHLLPASRWQGGSLEGPGGRRFLPNIPSEEVFTTPDFRHTTGRAKVTRPIEILGKPVEGAWFEFREGRVSDFGADEGKTQLDTWFGMDEHAGFLGEVALVDGASPIFQSGLIFHNLLYDENAACHIAFGNGYPFAVEGMEGSTEEEFRAAGINQSLLHTDFMIGTPALNVTGINGTGQETPILRNGAFVDPFV